MEAKKMFEKLDMEQECFNDVISYHFKNDPDYPFGYFAFIIFEPKHRNWRTNIKNLKKYDKAISQQMKELGWL